MRELHQVQINADSSPAFAIESATNLELEGVTARKPIAGSAVPGREARCYGTPS